MMPGTYEQFLAASGGGVWCAILLSQVGGSIFNGILFSNWIVNELSVSGQSIVVAKVGPCNFVLVGVALD